MNSWKIKSMKVVTCVLSLLIMSVAITGCKEENVESNTISTKQTEDKIYSIGEVGKTDTLEISITKAEKAKEWINGPAEGREYVVVSFNVKNISNEEQSVNANEFQFVNDGGNRESYERTTGVKANLETFGGETIAAGASFEGSLVYAIPLDMSHVELHYTEGYTLKPDLKFQFNK